MDVLWIYQQILQKREALRLERVSKILQFERLRGALPRTDSTDSAERTLAKLLDYKKKMRRTGKTLAKENEVLDMLAMHRRPRKDVGSSRRVLYYSRIKEVYDYCVSNGHLPKSNGSKRNDRLLARKFSRLCKSKSRFSPKETELFEKILRYRGPRLKSPLEKLSECLKYYQDMGELPSFSAKSRSDRHLAGFLHRFKKCFNQREASPEITRIWSVLKQGFPEKGENQRALIDYVSRYRTTPKHNSDLKSERQLASYLARIRSSSKRKKATPSEAALVNRIEEIVGAADPKGRIAEIEAFILKNRRRPRLNSDDILERRLAIRLGNLFQANRQGRLPQSLSSDFNSVYQLAWRFSTRS